MNEFDFQSGEFLDTLYTGSIYSDDSSITTESSTNPVTTNVGNYGTNVPTAEGSLFDHTRIVSTVAVTQGTNSITSSSTDIKSCQSFPPNFYTEISYENDADHEEKSREKASTAVKSELEPSSQTAEPVASSSSPTVQESQAPGIPVAPEPEIEIAINNVVCSFSVRCHLNLRKVATEGMNVIYKRENGMVSMKLRKPHTTASLWSSGKITCTGATSEADAKTAARRICRMLQRMGYRVRFSNFRVVNVLGTCTFPFGIRITSFSSNHKEASYEPELHPGVTYKIKDPKATLKIFSTGSITVTAPSVTNVQLAVEHIYPLVSNYRMEKKSGQRVEMVNSKMHLMPANRSRPGPGRFRNQPRMRGLIDDDDDEDYSSEMETSEDDYSETSEDDY